MRTWTLYCYIPSSTLLSFNLLFHTTLSVNGTKTSKAEFFSSHHLCIFRIGSSRQQHIVFLPFTSTDMGHLVNTDFHLTLYGGLQGPMEKMLSGGGHM